MTARDDDTRRERLVETLDRHAPVVMVAPALVLVGGVLGYPLLRALQFSLYRIPVWDVTGGTFVGVANYVTLFTSPAFALVVRNTAVFVGASVLGQVGLGAGFALLLDREWLDDRLGGALRATYVLPWATTGVVVGYSFGFLFDTRLGLVNHLLRAAGVGAPDWLHTAGLAMVAVVVANIWQGFPFSLVFQTSALGRIPDSLREAARVGGASPLGVFRRVTLPLLWPFLAMNLVLVSVFTINVFDVIFVMTGGGPLQTTEVLSLHLYETAFETGAFGRANAVAVVLLGVNLVLAGAYLTVGTEEVFR